jgi:hypothetical protein
VPAILARELVESLVNEVIVTGADAAARFGCAPMSLREAFVRARAAVEADNVPTRFVDADLVYFEPAVTDPAWAGGTVLRDVQERHSQCSAHEVFESISAIGGQRGWYSGEWLWRLRGLLDQLVGGPGLRRGRPRELHVGEALDFWRVEDLLVDQRLRLRAEMRLPGEAWLTWDITDDEDGCTLVQTAEYRPRGLFGRLYWLGVAPFHRFVFPGMIDGILLAAAGSAPLGGEDR